MLSLPVELINNILRFLNDQDKAALSATCKHLNISVNSPVICMPFLNRLKKLDKQISVIPPEEYQENWCYHRFVEGFNQIAQRQQTEIEYFLTTADLPKKLLKTLTGFNAPAKTLEALEERHKILENLNVAVIEKKISICFGPMTILRNCITRFPVCVFNAANKDFWSKLRMLDCSGNPLLRSLPSELGDCENLRHLDCGNNQIESLPPELSKCSKLKYLLCADNKLRSFPPELGQCPIKVLHCRNNQLSSIPIELLNLLNYSSNPFLNFDDNQIIIIPAEFKDKLGDKWFNDTLKTQKPDLSAYLPELITTLHNIQENILTNTPHITSSSTPEPIQHTGGEKRTLENDDDLNGNNDKDEYENSNKRKRPKK